MGIQVSLPNGGDPTFGFTYFLAENMAIRADLGLNISSLSGQTQLFQIDGGLRYYFMRFEHFMPFVEPGLYIANNAEANMDLALNAGLGGEYFVTDHFSFGAKTGVALNIAFPPKGGSTDVSFTTGTSAIFGQFLW